MYGNTLVAVYGSRPEAERVRHRLVEVGVPDDEIRLSSDESAPLPAEAEHREGFWDWLFGSNVPEYDRDWYQTNLREGRTALSVFARNETEREQAIRTLDESNPIEFEPPAQDARPDLAAATDVRTDVPAAPGDRPDLTPAAGAETAREGEQVIPVVKEELDVGKRTSERAFRVHTYVVEKPVEEQVHLRDERVVIERRPATGDETLGSADAPQEREFEVIERHEEPVVDKRVRKTEDVVVRKEATERTENVRDTVKETKVDVDKDQANPAISPDRKP
jgi:stress response protein YsnF